MPVLRPLVCTLLVAALPVALQAQSTRMAMDATPGMIMGASGHMATGNIHVVGAMGSQRIHFTSEFKTDGGSDLHAVLSTDMMAGNGSVDLGSVRGSGEQYVTVPAAVDVSRFSQLLIYDRKSKSAVASAPVPGGMMQHDGMMNDDGTMKKDDGMMKKDTSMARPN
ncbi:MAG: DM13 domain-containing protein [Gemmatimonadota bacterium]